MSRLLPKTKNYAQRTVAQPKPRTGLVNWYFKKYGYTPYKMPHLGNRDRITGAIFYANFNNVYFWHWPTYDRAPTDYFGEFYGGCPWATQPGSNLWLDFGWLDWQRIVNSSDPSKWFGRMISFAVQGGVFTWQPELEGIPDARWPKNFKTNLLPGW